MTILKSFGVSTNSQDYQLQGGNLTEGFQLTGSALNAPVRQGLANLILNRLAGNNVVWDGNPDAGLKMAVRNYAANAANTGAVRGLDLAIRNSGTNISYVNSVNFGARNDSGSTAYQLIGIQTRLENYGTLETEAVGLDVNMSIENDTGSPLKDAIRVRNTDGSGMTAVNSVMSISNTSTNGFTYMFDMNGLTAATGTIVSTTGTAATGFAGRIQILMPNGSAAYINTYSTSNV
jgi:hypothetical protein